MDDLLDSKAGVAGLAAALTAAIFSPRVRGVLHQGAVYGVAGVLRVGDTVNSFARGVGRGLHESRVAAGAGDGAERGAAESTAAAGGGSAGALASSAATATRPRRRGGSPPTPSPSSDAGESAAESKPRDAGTSGDQEATHD